MVMKANKYILMGLILICLCQLLSGLTIKMGSLTPQGSEWDKCLREVAAEWKKISGGKVIVKIYSGGIVGDEPVMLRKIKLGQLHAAAITGVGINGIYRGTLAMSMPMLIQTDAEFDYVLDKIRPFFEQKLEEEGYIALMWTFAGWTHWFGKKPIVRPNDLMSQKMWVWKGNSEEAQIWKKSGFKPVLLDMNDVMTSLSSGMVDAFATTPLNGAANQWFGISQNMCDMNWAPMLGGLVMSKRIWDKIPGQYHAEFMEVLERIGRKFKEVTLKADAEALKIMQENGLKVSSVSGPDIAAWQDIIDANFDELIDKNIGREAYELVKAYLEEYRESNG